MPAFELRAIFTRAVAFLTDQSEQLTRTLTTVPQKIIMHKLLHTRSIWWIDAPVQHSAATPDDGAVSRQKPCRPGKRAPWTDQQA